MANNDKIELSGKVSKILKGGSCIVDVQSNDSTHQVVCTPSGKLKMNKIRIVLGDTVTILVSPYDLTRGIVTWRDK